MGYKININYQLSTLFGLGRLPGGGTWASLVVLLSALLVKDPFDILLFLCLSMTIFAHSIYKNSLPFFTSKDPKEFVLDEVFGMALALTIVNVSSDIFGNIAFNLPDYINNHQLVFITTFILFRIFDISKIGPVGWTEDQTTAPLWWKNLDIADGEYSRVIGDDIVAAFLSSGIVIILMLMYGWL